MDTQHLKTAITSLSTTARWLIPMLLVMPALGGRAAPADPVAAITVNTAADELDGSPGNGHCSLREAITNANSDDGGQADCTAGSGADSITLPAGTYTLTGAAWENLNVSGDLDIGDDLTINGTDAKATIIQAGTSKPVGGSTCGDCVDRVLHILTGATVEINGVTVQFGSAPDGVSTVAGDRGGGIYNAGALTLNDCIVRWNRSGDGGDGTSAYNGGLGGDGGGIFTSGALELTGSLVVYNEAGDGGNGGTGTNSRPGGSGGGIFVSSSTSLTLTNSHVSDNTTGRGGTGGDAVDSDAGNGSHSGYGGAIFLETGSSLTLVKSTVARNTLGAGGAGGNVTSGNGDGGNGGGGGYGGGISSFGANAVVLVDSTVSGNETSAGGLGGTGSGTGSAGSDGDRGDGGGLYANGGSYTVRGCTISGNYASWGGGVLATGGSAITFTNCTVSGNRAYGSGGGFRVADAVVELTFVTVANNTADLDNDTVGDGGGIFAAGTVTMTNTIVAKNSDKGGENPDCWGWLASQDYNLLGVGDSVYCTFTSQPHDLEGTTAAPLDPGVANLTDNGGPTETHRLGASSPAVDQIPSGVNGCVVGVRDQRGVPRFPPCDIGAYEIDRAVRVYLPLTFGGS